MVRDLGVNKPCTMKANLPRDQAVVATNRLVIAGQFYLLFIILEIINDEWFKESNRIWDQEMYRIPSKLTDIFSDCEILVFLHKIEKFS